MNNIFKKSIKFFLFPFVFFLDVLANIIYTLTLIVFPLRKQIHFDIEKHKSIPINIVDSSDEIDISIIVPVYNVEDFLDDCIQSILINNDRIEYVFVNDNSPDRSIDILEKYSNNRNVKVINNPVNVGLGESRNIAINIARGKYLFFIDSDDFMSYKSIDNMLRLVGEHDFDICQGVVKRYYTGDSFDVEGSSFFDEVSSSSKIIEGYACGKLIKRTLFNDIRFPKGIAFEDIIIKHFILQKAKKIYVTDNFCYAYRLNRNSISFQFKKNDSSFDQYKAILFLEGIIGSKYSTLDLYQRKLLRREYTLMLINRTRHLSYRCNYEIINSLFSGEFGQSLITELNFFMKALIKLKLIYTMRLIFL